MTIGLGALFERADLPENASFNYANLEHWGLAGVPLPWLTPATTPTAITCPGCHEACLKPVRKHNGQAFIWCDEPSDLGQITLQQEDLEYWQLDMQALADMLAAQLETMARPIIPGRAYDLGVMEGHTLFLVRGVTWDKGQQPQTDTRICNANPLLITFSPPLESSLPVVWIGQLISLESGVLNIDRDRLMLALCPGTATEGNIFRKQGDVWHVRFEGKEAMVKDSKGMTYISHLLRHPHQDVPALTLQGLIDKPPPDDTPAHDPAFDGVAMLRHDELIDEQTRRTVQARIERLKATDPKSLLIAECEAYLRGGLFQGRSKAFLDANEKARQTVSKAISAAKSSITKKLPELGDYLKHQIKSGKTFQYIHTQKGHWQ